MGTGEFLFCMPATAIPGKARFASLSDPQGAAIALWEFA
jgi:predicted enzyme related to lactoylglutathione lyase